MQLAIHLFIFLTVCASLNAAKFHALLTADTKTANISTSAKKDLDHMKKACKVIAGRLQIPLTTSRLSGKKLTIGNVNRAIRKLKVGKDDCLLFYFSGHGLGTNSEKSQFPIIHFKPKNENIQLEQIEKALSKKKPRLLILLCDSCNTIERAHGGSASHFGEPKITVEQEAACFKKLFLETKGRIVATGSIPGEKAWGTNLGGWFTFAILRALELEPKEKKPSWKHVKKVTKKLLAQGTQTPLFKLTLD